MIDTTAHTAMDPDAVEAIMRVSPQVRARGYASFERRTLQGASLWYVTSEMCDLLEATLHGVPGDVLPTSLPEGVEAHGLVVFERPLLLHAREGGELRVDAVLWGHADVFDVYDKRPGYRYDDDPHAISALGISSYAHHNLDDGLSPDDLSRAAVPLNQLILAGTIDSDALQHRESGELAFSVHGDIWTPLGRSDWPMEDRIDEAHYLHPSPEGRASAEEDRRLLAAFWTLVNQHTVTTTQVAHAPRHVARRSVRAGLPREASDVRVVILRKLAAPGDHPVSPSGRKLDHRVLVGGETGGFWRHQPCGPGRAERKLIWIDPYVRGPEGTELRTPVTVRLWKR